MVTGNYQIRDKFDINNQEFHKKGKEVAKQAIL